MLPRPMYKFRNANIEWYIYRHEGDSNGELTCFTTNGSSVVDYVVASSEIMHIIEDFSINPPP